jgi:hypothetical protein
MDGIINDLRLNISSLVLGKKGSSQRDLRLTWAFLTEHTQRSVRVSWGGGGGVWGCQGMILELVDVSL